MLIEGKRFLLTGGASMIGTCTTELLLAKGAREVLLFDNLSFDEPDGTVDALCRVGAHAKLTIAAH